MTTKALAKTTFTHPQSGETWVCFSEKTTEVSKEDAANLLPDHIAAQKTAKFAIIPLDETATIRWSLPPSVATLVESPVNCSRVMVRSDDAIGIESSEELWQAIVAAETSCLLVLEGYYLDNHNREFPLLVPRETKPPEWLTPHFENPTGGNTRSTVDEIALKAGLLQIHGALHQSHSLSQSIEGEGLHRAGDYWHAIMHRREADYGNSKYWFRHVGQHPIFENLAIHASRILDRTMDPDAQHWKLKLCQGGWDAFVFVDLAQHCGRDETTSLAKIAREIQWVEMILLLSQTHEDAHQVSKAG